jgi:MATE family multidrug resistance protein
LSVFLTDPEAIRVATMPLRLTGLTACGDAVSLTMQNALLGVGDVKTVALVSILAQWAVFLPIAWFSVHKLNQGLFCVWAIYVLYRVGVGMVYAWLWKRGKWLDALNV